MRRALLAFVAFALTLLAMELLAIGLAAAGLVAPDRSLSVEEDFADRCWRIDRHLRHANLRGSAVRAFDRCQTNSLGLRGGEVAIPKPAGVYRIVALGDSTVFGWGVDEPSTFTRRLELLMDRRQDDVDVDVVNAGVSGYSLFQVWTYLRRQGVALDPDLLVVLTSFNDRRAVVDASGRDTASAYATFYYRTRLRALLSGSAAYRALGAVIWPARPRSEEPARAIDVATVEARVGPDRYRRLLSELIAFSRERSIEVVLVPHRDDPRLTFEFDAADRLLAEGDPATAVERLRSGIDRAPFYRIAAARRINAILAEHPRAGEPIESVDLPGDWLDWDGASPVDVSAPYDAIMRGLADEHDGVVAAGIVERERREPSVYLDQIHLNALGNRLLAKRLAAAILRESELRFPGAAVTGTP